MPTHVELARTLARRFIERAEELGYKGKKRDDAALDYFVGAAVLAELQGNKLLYEHLGRVALFVIAVRGYFGVKELAAKLEDA